MNDSLPASWATATIGNVCEPVSKRGPDGAKRKFRYVDLSSIDRATKSIANATTLDTTTAPSRAKQVLASGDVLFSNVRVYLETIAQVPDDLEGEIGSTAFCVLRPGEDIEPRYLYHFVTSRKFVLAVDALQRGNSPPSVQDSDVRQQTIPIAPPKEQRRIVSKIDELFSRIDEGEQALKRVEKLLERYRQSVLKAAVTGELTRDWRAARKRAGEPVESGEALLARILKARRAAWETAELAKLKAKGKPPTDDRWKQKYQEPVPPDTTGLPELPEAWVWCSGAQLFEWSSGDFLPAKAMRSGGYVVYGGNGINGSHDSWNVDAATLVIGRVGAHCGNVYRTTGKCWITDNAIFAISTPHQSSLAYLELCLRSAKLRSQAQGGAQPFVNQKALNEVAIPLPSIQEQDAIVSIVSEALDRVQRLTAACNSENVRSTALRQSILKAAFSGQLVPQDPNDEPASRLLEQIAAERAATPTSRQRKKQSA